MKIEAIPGEFLTIIKLSWRFDAYSAPDFSKWVAGNCPSSTAYLVVDSSALAALVQEMKRYRENGVDIIFM